MKKIKFVLFTVLMFFSVLNFTACTTEVDELPEEPPVENTEVKKDTEETKKEDPKKDDPKKDESKKDDSKKDPENQQPPSPIEEVTVAAQGLPVISITATTPKDYARPLAFVTEPVSDTVKLHSHTWGSTEYDDKPAPWYEDCLVTVKNGDDSVALQSLPAKVKARGNWTTSYDKKGLKIKFEDKQSVLGLHNDKKYKEWVLLAAWKDFSMLRDYSAFYLSRLIDSNYYASDSKLVEVYINGNYWGVYLLAEQQENKRVGIDETEGVTNTGYLLEYDGYASIIENQSINGELMEQDFIKLDGYGSFTDINGMPVTTGEVGYTIKSKYDDAKKAYIKSKLQSIWNTCRDAIEGHEADEVIPPSIESVIDINSLVNTFIMSEIACDLDLSWSSFYMDFDDSAGKKLTFEAPWDFDSCFGNHNKYPNQKITGLFSLACNSTVFVNGNPWTILFGKAKWFQDLVGAKWTQMNSSNVKTQLLNEIDSISDNPIYVAAFKRNYDKWQNIGKNIDETVPEAIACQTQKQAALVLKTWFNDRFAELDTALVNFTSNYNPYEVSVSKTNFDYWDNDVYQGKREDNYSIHVKAEDDGLHITKSNNSEYKRVNLKISDETDPNNPVSLLGFENIDSCDNEGILQNPLGSREIVYPFVENGHFYKITMELMDKDWKYWHSIETKVLAKGGSGNLCGKFDSVEYDSESNSVILNNYSGTLNERKTELGEKLKFNARLWNDKVWGEHILACDETTNGWGRTFQFDSTTPNKLLLGSIQGDKPSELYIIIQIVYKDNTLNKEFEYTWFEGKIYPNVSITKKQ